MTPRHTFRKSELTRAAKVARETGCRIEIKVGDTVITVIPDEETRKDSGIDHLGHGGISYGKPVM